MTRISWLSHHNNMPRITHFVQLLCILGACLAVSAKPALNGTSNDAKVMPASIVSPHALSLIDCFHKAKVYTVAGNDPGYNEARSAFSEFFHFWPTAVVYPSSTKQVQAAIKCARQHDVQVHPRCGNHANEGETVATGDVTLDLSNMTAVKMSPDGNFVTVQAGARVGQVISALWVQSKGTRSYPGGQRPVVGVSGYSLGGGFGQLTRFAGLASDNIISLKAVDSAGNEIIADEKQNTDLLWASRGGGGGNFVVVTEFVFRTSDVSMGVTTMDYTVPPKQIVPVLNIFQKWQATLPWRFTMRADCQREGGSRAPTVTVGGACFGSEQQCRLDVMKSGLPLNGPLTPSSFSYNHTDFLTAAAANIGWPLPVNVPLVVALATPSLWNADRSYYKYKSMILDKPLPDKGIESLINYCVSGKEAGSTVWELQALGGAMTAVPSDATATANLQSGSQIVIMRATSKDQAAAEEGLALATATIQELSELAPTTSGYYKAYVNFLDTDVPGIADWKLAYYGPELTALQCVKAKYDPANMFNLPLEIGDPESGDYRLCGAIMARAGAAAAAWSQSLRQNAPARPV